MYYLGFYTTTTFKFNFRRDRHKVLAKKRGGTTTWILLPEIIHPTPLFPQRPHDRVGPGKIRDESLSPNRIDGGRSACVRLRHFARAFYVILPSLNFAKKYALRSARPPRALLRYSNQSSRA